VIKTLEKTPLENTKLLSLFQLTPELCLQLQDANKIIFVDASYSEKNQYALACSLENSSNNTLSHHISPLTLMQILKDLYNKNIDFEIFSILTKNFDTITNNSDYTVCIETTAQEITFSIKK